MTVKSGLSADQFRGRLLKERDDALRVIEELLCTLLPFGPLSESRYSQGVQSAMKRAQALLERMKETDAME